MKFEDLSATGRPAVYKLKSTSYSTPFPDKHFTIQMLCFKQPCIKKN